MIVYILTVLIAYLLGSISSSIIVCKMLNLSDPRDQGSGNAGATNVLRFASKKIAIVVLLGDILKGVIVVLLAKMLLANNTIISIIIFAVIVGHIFPVFFKFQGGKGLATFFGVLIVLSPSVSLIALCIWGITAYLFRYSSLASIVSTICSAIISVFFIPQFCIAITCSAILVIAKHHQNIARLYQGNESKIGSKTKSVS